METNKQNISIDISRRNDELYSAENMEKQRIVIENCLKDIEKAINGTDEDKERANLSIKEASPYIQMQMEQLERFKQSTEKLMENSLSMVQGSNKSLFSTISRLAQNLDVPNLTDLSGLLYNMDIFDIKDFLSPFKHYIESLPADEREEAEEKLREAVENELPKLPPSEQKELTEVFQSIIPKNHIRPNNKLVNQITKDFLNQGEIELVVSGKTSKKVITTKAILTYGGDNITLTGDFDFLPYDMEVHDGVITLWEAGNIVFTASMLYRAMNGQVKTEYINQQALDEVNNSLAKSRVININIDFTNEAKMYRNDIKKAQYDNFLLIYDKITITAGGQEVEAYKLLRKPILYEYAQISGQIISVPLNYLHTNKKISNSNDVIVIRGYLLKQIEDMKSDSFKRSNHILYQGIFDTIKLYSNEHSESMYKKKTFTARKQAKAILSHWIDEKYIHGFEEYKNGNTFIGLVIHLKKQKNTPK